MLADRGMTREQINDCTIEWVATVVFAARDNNDGQLMLYKNRGKTNVPQKQKHQFSTDPVDRYAELFIARGFPKQQVLDYLAKVKAQRNQLLKEAGL